MWVVRQDVEAVLKVQLGLTSLVMTAVLYPVATWALPAAIHIQGVPGVVTPLTCFFCIISGLWGGCIIGFITEYYTSHSYQPVGIPSPLPLSARSGLSAREPRAHAPLPLALRHGAAGARPRLVDA